MGFLNDKVNALLALYEYHTQYEAEILSHDVLKNRMNSLAKEVETMRLANMENARLLDSIESAKFLAEQKATRLADFREKLVFIPNGLDGYTVTQTAPGEAVREKLDMVAELMKDYPDLIVRLIGHTCDRGTYNSNIYLGMQRAEGARNYLINKKDINASRIETASKAETEPVVPNTSEDNRLKNRRIQIEILEGSMP
jgi:flagellar motor protein MotB